jgi:hypothetical protein
LFYSLQKRFLWLPAQNVTELLPITIALTAKKKRNPRLGLILNQTLRHTDTHHHRVIRINTTMAAGVDMVGRSCQPPQAKYFSM